MGSLDAGTIRDIVIVLVPMILSLTVHEFAHAWSAHKLGDDTARSMGRMTLNPLPHIDPMGTILFPVLSVLGGSLLGGRVPFFGWAKPVPVTPYRFKRSISMRNGMIITALAGPASNLVLAFFVCGAWMLVDKLGLGVTEGSGELALQGRVSIDLLLGQVFLLNIGLAVFNMLPVPPLDGSRLLPLDWQEKASRYQFVTFIVLILAINRLGWLFAIPVNLIGGAMVSFWSLIF